jgi:hypothetical protein
MGANFRLWLKKSPRLSHAKAPVYGPAPVAVVLTRATVSLCMVEQIFGGFLDLCENVF